MHQPSSQVAAVGKGVILGDDDCLGCAADKSHTDSVDAARRLAAEHSAYWATRPPLTLSDLFGKYIA